jgi:polyisoprenoid-binding protein YceI
MNNKISLAYLMLIMAPLFSAYREPVVKENEDNALASFVYLRPIENEKYVIDKKESVVAWKGSMSSAPVLLGFTGHTGYVYISKGELIIEKSQLVGGTIEIDMNTIEYKDKQHPNSPIKHLKSPDFFDVEKFPISSFAITKVASVSAENIKITGNLTIKGITYAVTFPAKIEVKGGIVNANGKLIIDRTQWGIRYKSEKFYANLADEAISDDIEFDMKIIAKK